jgi:hypothetical protein
MYLTDLQDSQWQIINKILKMLEIKRKYDLLKIWGTVFYVVKADC